LILTIINIRIKQLYRNISGIGLFRILVLALLVSITLFFIFTQIKIYENGFAVTGLQLILLTFFHFVRKDKRFLFTVTDKQFRIFFAEYTLYSLPFIILDIIALRFELILINLSGIAIISLLKMSYTFKKHNLNNFIIRLIPNDNFEIKSGLRKHFWYIIPLYLISLGFSFWIGTVPAAIFLFTSFFIGFYLYGESRNILEIKELSPKRFILNKIKCQTKIFLITLLPLLLLNTIFNLEYSWISFGLTIISLLVITFVIFLKYAMYQPNTDLSGGSVLGAFSLLSIILPFILPAIIILAIIYYYRAINNLNLYLNDYN
jgi:hypothetical protein